MAVLSPVPVRNAVVGQGGLMTDPWTRFMNDLRAAASAIAQQTPAASSTPSDLSVPIVINGVTYYLRLSSTP